MYERFFGRKRLRYPYLARPIPAATYAELAAKPGWAKSEVPVAPGVQLRGLVRKPTSAEAPWVLFYPGNDESQLERGQAFLVKLGGELDWGLAVFAYRGYDASDGKPALDDIGSDAPEIVTQLCKAQGIPESRLHIAGFSIGGHFAVRAAGGVAKRGKRAASLTLLASVNDIVMYHASPWEKLSAGEDYQTTPYLTDVPEPILVIQGAADKTFEGPGEGRAISKALGTRAEYVELDGVDHVPLLADAGALERTRAFIQRHAR
jgi:pimeloyl-ACP methyl ester carboxylesterase